MKTQRRSAAEILAFHFNMDIEDMRYYRYHPTQLATPAVFSLDFTHEGVEYAYAATPSNGKMKPGYASLDWVLVGEEYGRKIFGATGA
jgi:hypothetical protein